MIAQSDLPTDIPDLARILIRSGKSDGRRDVQSHKDSVRGLVIPVSRNGELVPQHSVDSDVQHPGSLPSDIFIGKNIQANHRINYIIGRNGTDGKVLCSRIIRITDILVSEFSVGRPEFQFSKGVLHRDHKRLLSHTPCT